MPAASVSVSPNPVRTKAVAVLSSPSPKPIKQQKFSRRWVWPLLLIAAAGLLGAGIVWPQGFIATDVRQPTGGVYLMYKPTGDSAAEMFSSFDLAVKVWETGYSGYSIMSLTWKASDLSKPVPRDWFVVASGQYATPTEAPVELYCRYPGARAVGDIVRCRDVEDPLKGVEYRIRGEIGKVSDRALVAIEDYRGYDETAVTLVSASVADGYQPGKYSEPFEVQIPFRSPAVADFGASSLVRFAGMNLGDGEYGLGRMLRELPPGSTLSEADFADPVDQRALWFPRLNSTDFEVLEQLDARQVQWSVPAAQDPGRLRWHVDEAGLARGVVPTV